MKEKDILLFIPNNIMSNQFSNFAIATFCSLQSLVVPIKSKSYCTNANQLLYRIVNDIDCFKNRRKLDYIKCGLNELIENKVINSIYEIKGNYILDCSNLWIDTNNSNYIIITFNEVIKIFEIENVNNFSLLRYYIYLIGTISNKITVYLEDGQYKNHVIGNFTIEYLSQLTGISKRTIIEYNKILEDNKLIYINRQNDFVIDEGNNIKQLPNVYGRFKDIQYIDTFANNQKKFKESYKYVKNNIEKINNKRRLAQKYQQLLKGGGKSYTKEEIQEIYIYVINENKKYYNTYDKTKNENILDKIRDVQIFKQFDIKTENI